MTSSVLVKSATFKNFDKSDNGGVFEISGRKFEIICCKFDENSVSRFGGCIYASDSNTSIINCYFHNCFSTAKTDNVCGNAVYVIKNEARIIDVSTYLCGTQTYSSDSAIRIDNAKTIVDKMNSTMNYGYGGSSAISIQTCSEGTSAKYINECDGYDNSAIESVSNIYTVYTSNFINCTNHNVICWIDRANTIAFDSCVFWNVGSKSNIATRNCTATNCISNTALTGVSIAKYSTNLIIVKASCRIRIITKFNNCRNVSRNYLLCIILLIST